MLSRVPAFSILGLVIVWLVHFTSLSYAAHSVSHNHLHTHHRRANIEDVEGIIDNGLNERAHAYEKLFLWEAYKIIGQIDGYNKQKLILPFRLKNDGTALVSAGRDNRHLITVGGSETSTNYALDYPEFMLRLGGKNTAIETHPDITAPDSEDDLVRAEQELTDKHLDGLIKMKEVNPYLKVGDSTQIHTRFIEKVTERVDAIRNDAEKSSIGDVSNRLSRADTISQRMILLRKASTINWLIKYLTRDDGWNLQKTEDGITRTTVATVDDAETGVPGAAKISKYQSIDFPATFADPLNTAKIEGKNIESGVDFQTWANELGDVLPSTNGPSASDSSVSHWQEIVAWEDKSWIDEC
ncbi:uncharacterized protein N7500_001776 [Penicillium coprophilum]|uniref:uncharacterized protein n=1 Tax=Penicillium coprophilum TaxID=36646 RepID=UPI00239546E1|nr:uncharacterized protein N7500_001776 [Penicillium coprophilum]KAJ5173845.1 hypothetical protein N7500_001776 [Penicillium coprophilum]